MRIKNFYDLLKNLYKNFKHVLFCHYVKFLIKTTFLLTLLILKIVFFYNFGHTTVITNFSKITLLNDQRDRN